MGSRILIVTDAWYPQLNGVVRTLEATRIELERMGHDVRIVGPDTARWCTIPLPSYPLIKLEFFAYGRIRRLTENFRPDFIHIATEGPLGWSARRFCLRHGHSFTTSYHTQFPEYVSARLPRGLVTLLRTLTYMFVRRFHASSEAVMVATHSVMQLLQEKGFRHLVLWSRGVDTRLFHPYEDKNSIYEEWARPILLYVGRVAVEKNIEAFLATQVLGSKIVIGEGPDFCRLSQRYPHVHFLGKLEGETLARCYAGADIFVFPSRTDTFGLVLLEACAADLKIASYPSMGPIDIFSGPTAQSFAVLDEDLEQAILKASALSPAPLAARSLALTYGWDVCTRQFFQALKGHK